MKADMVKTLIKYLEEKAYSKTDETEVVLSLKCENKVFKYCLPEGFTISSFALDSDINKHNRVIYICFDHEGEYAAHCGMY